MLDKQLPKDQLLLYSGFAGISIISIIAAVATGTYALVGVPFVILFAYLAVIDLKKIFYLLLFSLPLSMDIELGGGLNVDLPSELLMVALMFIFILFAIGKWQQIDFRFLKQPAILILIVHVFWIGLLILFAQNQLVTFKYFLAKNWYILTFVFLGGVLLRSKDSLRKFFWLIYIPLTILVIQVIIRYATYGFDFEFVNEPMKPFFRNHVNYAAMTTIFVPFIWLAASWYPRGSFKRIILNISKVIYLTAIYLSYTRACYLALAIAVVMFVLMKWNLVKPVAIAALVVAGVVLSTLAYDNNYLKLAPEYTKTIHHKNFSDHIVATYNLEDVSSMERVYRWVSAFYMTSDKPVTGFGPGNFYPYYKGYTVTDFETYTSDNDEKSTVHNYFLLTMVEQGVPGLLIFIAFTIALFFAAQNAYKRARSPETKAVIMTAILSLTIVYVNLMLSDLVEVDKTGSLYYLAVAILMNYAIKADEEAADHTAINA